MDPAIEPIDRAANAPPRASDVPKTLNDGAGRKPFVCFKCGEPGHKTNTCKGQATDAGKAALESYRRGSGRSAKFQTRNNNKNQKRGGEGGEALTAALVDALDKATAEREALREKRRDEAELTKELTILEKENQKLKLRDEQRYELLVADINDLSGRLTFEWSPLGSGDFTLTPGLQLLVSSPWLLALLGNYFHALLTNPTLANWLKWTAIWGAGFHAITAVPWWNLRLALRVLVCFVRYKLGYNAWIMRHAASVGRPYRLLDHLQRDLRPDSTSLIDVKHNDPMLADICYTDRLTGRVSKKVISVELFVQNTTGLNMNYLDAEEVIRARIHSNVPRNMTVSLNRYDVLKSRQVVLDTADAVVCFYRAIRDKRQLETPGF